MEKECNKYCCPLQIVDNYNSLKQNLEKEFVEHINMWIKEHPYVKMVTLSKNTSCCYSSSIISFDKESELKASIMLQ